jgi:hypothetical protein
MKSKSQLIREALAVGNQIGALTPFIERPRTTGDHL